MILFLTNNDITKPLIKWLKSKEKVLVITKKITKNDIKKLKPELIISYNYKYIISKDLLQLLPNKFINLHISYLPYNRGAHPNIWSHIENTLSGVTIHLIDHGIDTGDILLQRRVVISDDETLNSSYKKLHFHIQMLFKKNWFKIKRGKIKPRKQRGKGTIHYKKDLKKVEHLLTEGFYTKIYKLKGKL